MVTGRRRLKEGREEEEKTPADGWMVPEREKDSAVPAADRVSNRTAHGSAL